MAEIDFDEWLANYKPPELKFYASFNTSTGDVIGIYPSTALPENSQYVEIDQETAHLITEGKISLNSCFVDMSSGKFEIAEIKRLTKIDDVLHRIMDKSYAGLLTADLMVIRDSNALTFELSEKYKKRKIHWDGATEMTFLVTEYNDPNIVRHSIKFTVDELVSSPQTVADLDLSKKFSIYTKRLFPVYLFDTK
jgi:hypothetical protein